MRIAAKSIQALRSGDLMKQNAVMLAEDGRDEDQGGEKGGEVGKLKYWIRST